MDLTAKKPQKPTMNHEETMRAIDDMIEKLKAERLLSEERTKKYKEQLEDVGKLSKSQIQEEVEAAKRAMKFEINKLHKEQLLKIASDGWEKGQPSSSLEAASDRMMQSEIDKVISETRAALGSDAEHYEEPKLEAKSRGAPIPVKLAAPKAPPRSTLPQISDEVPSEKPTTTHVSQNSSKQYDRLEEFEGKISPIEEEFYQLEIQPTIQWTEEFSTIPPLPKVPPPQTPTPPLITTVRPIDNAIRELDEANYDIDQTIRRSEETRNNAAYNTYETERTQRVEEKKKTKPSWQERLYSSYDDMPSATNYRAYASQSQPERVVKVTRDHESSNSNESRYSSYESQETMHRHPIAETPIERRIDVGESPERTREHVTEVPIQRLDAPSYRAYDSLPRRTEIPIRTGSYYDTDLYKNAHKPYYREIFPERRHFIANYYDTYDSQPSIRRYNDIWMPEYSPYDYPKNYSRKEEPRPSESEKRQQEVSRFIEIPIRLENGDVIERSQSRTDKTETDIY